MNKMVLFSIALILIFSGCVTVDTGAPVKSVGVSEQDITVSAPASPSELNDLTPVVNAEETKDEIPEADKIIEGDSFVSITPVNGSEENIIEITASGFKPSVLVVSKGETVLFKSTDGTKRWPASNVHPVHTVYPGSNISHCFDASDISMIFDACALLSEYSFTFNEVGSWNYHDHESPAKTGTIIVE